MRRKVSKKRKKVLQLRQEKRGLRRRWERWAEMKEIAKRDGRRW